MIISDDIALLVHAQATVNVAIVGKTNVQALLHNKLLESLNVSGAYIVIDVQAIRLVIDDVGICAQCIEHRLSNFQELPLAQPDQP